MSEPKVILEPGVAQKLQFAIQRNGGSLADVDFLSTGNNFLAVSLLRTGRARLVVENELCDEDRTLPIVSEEVSWRRDVDSNIHLEVTSTGMTIEQWIQHFGIRGFSFDGPTLHLFRRRLTEEPTNGVIYHVVILPTSRLKEENSTTKKILAYVSREGWRMPHWEVAFLLRDKISSEGLRRMRLGGMDFIQKSAKHFRRNELVLSFSRGGSGYITVLEVRSNVKWRDEVFDEERCTGGCAFVVSATKYHH